MTTVSLLFSLIHFASAADDFRQFPGNSLAEVPHDLCEDALQNKRSSSHRSFGSVKEQLLILVKMTYRLPLLEENSPTAMVRPLIESLVQDGVLIEPNEIEAAFEAITYAKQAYNDHSPEKIFQLLESRFLVKNSDGIFTWRETFGNLSRYRTREMRLHMMEPNHSIQ